MHNHPIRIQRSRQHKQISPNELPIVYVGRPGRWGNPYKVGDINGMGKVVTAEMALEYYEFYIKRKYQEHLAEALAQLRGKNLSCWCKVGEPCHADVLLKLANQ